MTWFLLYAMVGLQIDIAATDHERRQDWLDFAIITFLWPVLALGVVIAMGRRRDGR